MISIPELRAKLNLSVEFDSDLLMLALEVVALFETKTGRLWDYREDYEEIIRTSQDNQKSIWLSLSPIEEVSSVEVKDDEDDDYTELETSEFKLHGTNVLTRVGTEWEKNVKVTYTGGYTKTSCPSDVKQALILQAIFSHSRHSRDNIMIKGKTFGDGSAQFYEAADLHPFFKSIVESKRVKY